jgi:murein hydrolase activator
MHRRLTVILLFSLLVALTQGLVEPALSQSRAKQSSKKAKPPAKTHPEKEKRQAASLSDMQKEKARLKAEAEAYEKKFNKSKEKENATLAGIRTLEQQIDVKRRTIKKLQDQEKQLTGEIQEARSSITDLEQQLESLKGQYARYVRSVYKYGRVYDVELLFSSQSINQLYIRIEYLKRFSDQRAKDLHQVVHNRDDLEHQNQRLVSNLEGQQRVLARRTGEESSLSNDVTKHQRMLATIRKDKEFYREQANEKTEAYKKLDNIIAELIRKENERKEREAAAGAPHPTPVPDASAGGSFAAQRGKLRWPVSSGAIASRFGKQIHPVLKTERENTGIDISVGSENNVLAVADGTVSIVTFIPGFGNIVILTHGGGYRTIYAHLSEVAVNENQKVKAGEVIAKSGVSVDGKVLHFEIWKEKEKQNPELWLAKQ